MIGVAHEAAVLAEVAASCKHAQCADIHGPSVFDGRTGALKMREWKMQEWKM